MSRKQTAITLTIIILIFSVGFFLRLECTDLEGIPQGEKSFYQDQNGLPYMYELDSYYNYRLTRNYLDHGYLGDDIVKNVEWDLHSYYPPGVPLDYPPLIAYLTVFIYKFVNVFAEIPLLVVCFWLPAFIAPLAGITAYLFVARFTNQYGAFAAGLLAVTVPFYFVRTIPGWFDTDMFILGFSFLVVWFLFETFDNIDTSAQKAILFTFLSAVSIFLFSLAWSGWQYLFYIIIIFWAIQIIWRKFRGRTVKNYLYCFLVFLVTTLSLVVVFTGFISIIKLASAPSQLFNLSNGHWSDWPNVYFSVSELRQPTLEDLISYLGVSIFAGLFGIFWIFRLLSNDLLHQKYLNRMNWASFSFLLLWIIAGLITLTQGVRFIMILIPPLVISTGIMIGILVDHLNLLKKSNKIHIFHRNPVLIKVFAIFILIIVLLPGIIHLQEGGFITTNINDDMWEASLWIKNNTANNTVVMGSWSGGHLYTAIAERPVSEDGRMGYIETLPVRNYDDLYPHKEKSPSISRDYWINKAFSTDNESLSIGILRMLSTSGDEGYIKLNLYINDTNRTVEVLNNILGLDRSTSKDLLINNYNLDKNQAEEILKYTHPDNPAPLVLITHDNMINIGHWTFKFGEWNFNERKSNNYSYSVGTVNKNDDYYNFTNGVFLDLKTGDITWKNRTPYCVVFVNNGTLDKSFLDSSSDFCVFIIDYKTAVVIDKKFENSIFTKLVIEKSNSTVFKPLYSNKSVVVWGIQA